MSPIDPELFRERGVLIKLSFIRNLNKTESARLASVEAELDRQEMALMKPNFKAMEQLIGKLNRLGKEINQAVLKYSKPGQIKKERK